LIRPTVTIVSTTRWPVRQWRIVAAADRTAPEPFFHCRVSRREQSLRPSHTVVTDSAAVPGGPAVGDLFAA